MDVINERPFSSVSRFERPIRHSPVCALLAARNRYLCAQPMVTEMSGSAVTGRIAAFAPSVRRQGVTPGS